jgi:hypothetical protein
LSVPVAIFVFMTTTPEHTAPVHPLAAALAAAEDAVAHAGSDRVSIAGLSDADLEEGIEACERVRARLHHVLLGLVHEADARELGKRSGGYSTPAWLRGRFRIRPGDARRLVDIANATIDIQGPEDYAANVKGPLTGRELTHTGKLLVEGVTSPEHVAVVHKIMRQLPNHVTVDQAQSVERDLAKFCADRFDPLEVAKLGACLLHLYDSDTLDDDDDSRHRRRELRLNPATGALSGRLTAEGMTLLSTALEPLAVPNAGPDGERDPRSAGQRLADALVELARRMLAAGRLGASHGMSHKVLVSIALETLFTDHTHNNNGDGNTGNGDGSSTGGTGDGSTAHGDGPADNARSADGNGVNTGGAARHDGAGDEATGDDAPGDPGLFAHPTSNGNTDSGGGAAQCPVPERTPGQPASGIAPGIMLNGQPVSAAAIRRITCFAGIQRIILNPDGVPLNVGREYRTVTPAQFVALIIRDGGCAFPGCTRDPGWCVAHHIKHWADGGDTDLDNLVLLCSYHHTVIHHRGWTVRTAADRLPDFIPPAWVDPEQTPRRNPRPKHTDITRLTTLADPPDQ